MVERETDKGEKKIKSGGRKERKKEKIETELKEEKKNSNSIPESSTCFSQPRPVLLLHKFTHGSDAAVFALLP